MLMAFWPLRTHAVNSQAQLFGFVRQISRGQACPSKCSLRAHYFSFCALFNERAISKHSSDEFWECVRLCGYIWTEIDPRTSQDLASSPSTGSPRRRMDQPRLSAMASSPTMRYRRCRGKSVIVRQHSVIDWPTFSKADIDTHQDAERSCFTRK